MRRIQNINKGWRFKRGDQVQWQAVDLPHTWNAEDGQDGGNDYYRGKGTYMKQLELPVIGAGEQVWLEFRGVNASADVTLDGVHLGHHDGGYSTFRVRLPEEVGEGLLAVEASNAPSRTVYPQKADFTFYGGIYRDVGLIVVPETHFALGWHGAPGLQVTARVEEDGAAVALCAFVEGGAAAEVCFTVEGVGCVTAPVREGKAEAMLYIQHPRLWDGVDDPYLYTASAALLVGETAVDRVEARFGCRSFAIGKNGFTLNGRVYPLRGVSRHQDWEGVGNAITREMMETDIGLMREMGANTVRLAHYQHDQYFYDLCDEAGLVVWAEIPYISEHMPEGRANTVSQLTELICQCYSHPSIVCWGLSNEITAVGGPTEDIMDNHRELDALAHRLDPTRPTVTANVFMLEVDDPLLDIPDAVSYNLYFGWYVGAPEDNDAWFDDFRKKNPEKAIGLAEYGADANPRYQTGAPERADYTEQYQCVYHEYMLEMFRRKPYLWATHVWNMFDFAADGRDEGGKHGQNQKGLVTFDRTLKKDAFYAYKAYWSKEPFVHLCSRRYVDRAEAETEIKVYSNGKKVALYDNGTLCGVQEGGPVFRFRLPLTGAHVVEARCGDLVDRMEIRRVEEPNTAYILESNVVVNWFEQEGFEAPEGYFSIKDTMGDIKQTEAGARLVEELMAAARAKRGDVAQGVKMNDAMQRMMDAMTVESMARQAGDAITPEMLKALNKALNGIVKPV